MNNFQSQMVTTISSKHRCNIKKPSNALMILSVVSIWLTVSSGTFAAEKLNDKELRHATETNTSLVSVRDVLDCPKDMPEADCNRLQYENYANQVDRSYDEFLKTETTNPLRNRVIKQPLLTQPLEKPNVPQEPRPTINDLNNQLKSVINTAP